MRVMIAADDNQKDVCVVFARTPYFAVADTKKEEVTFLENPAVASQSGAGVQAAQFIVDQGADALITIRCGENAAQVLREAKIAIYRACEGDISQNMDALRCGKLSLLEKFHGGFHGRK